MSEQSESVHVWRQDPNAVRAAANSAHIAGRIVASNDRWTCFVPSEDETSNLFAQCVAGIALVWSYAEDFGLWLTLFESGRQVGTINFEWGTAPQPEVAKMHKLLSDIGIAARLGDLHQMASEVEPQGRAPRDVRDAIAAALGLAAWDWLSPQYSSDTALEELRLDFPEAEEV